MTNSQSAWRARIDSHCEIGDDHLRVVEVSDLQRRDGQHSFSVVFELDDPRPVEQGTYDVVLDDGASIPLFLVPISARQLEAVFNIMIEECA